LMLEFGGGADHRDTLFLIVDDGAPSPRASGNY